MPAAASACSRTFCARWAHKIILDPHQFELPPKWRRIGGADHGKANPTAFLEAAIDYDGNIYLLAHARQQRSRSLTPLAFALRGSGWGLVGFLSCRATNG